MVVILTVTAIMCAYASGMLIAEAFHEIRHRVDDWWTASKFLGAATFAFAAWAAGMAIHP